MSEIEKTREYVNKVANFRNRVLQPDEEILNNLITGLTENKDRYGYRSCPCRLATGEKDKDKDIICPCDYSDQDLSEYGHCFCALYFSKEYLDKGGEFRQIPERRPEEKL